MKREILMWKAGLGGLCLSGSPEDISHRAVREVAGETESSGRQKGGNLSGGSKST